MSSLLGAANAAFQTIYAKAGVPAIHGAVGRDTDAVPVRRQWLGMGDGVECSGDPKGACQLYVAAVL